MRRGEDSKARECAMIRKAGEQALMFNPTWLAGIDVFRADESTNKRMKFRARL